MGGLSLNLPPKLKGVLLSHMVEPNPKEKTKTVSSLLSQFIKETLYTSSSTGITTVLGIVNVMILTRYLSRIELGVFLLLDLVCEFLRTISTFGVDVSVIQCIASASEEDKRKIADSAVVTCLLTSCVATVLFFWGQNWFYALFGGGTAVEVGIFVPFLLLTRAYRALLRYILQGYLRFRQMALIDVITSFLNLLMIFVFIMFAHARLTGQIMARLISWGIGCLIFYLAIPGPKSLHIYPKQLWRVMRFGLPLQVNTLIEFVVSRAGVLLIAITLGPAEVALLTVAGTIPGKVMIFYDSFNSVYFPRLSKLLADGDKQKAQKLLNTTLRLISFATAFLALCGALFARELIILFFSTKYLEGATVFILSAVALNISLVGLVVGMSLLSSGDSKNVTFTSLAASIIILPSNLLAITRLGVNGVPVARIAGNVFGTLVNAWFMRRKQLLANMWEAYKPTLIMLCFWIPLFFLPPLPWLHRGVVIVLFLGLCYLTSVITREDVAQATALVRAYIPLRKGQAQA